MNVAICSIIKDEKEEYLREWIEYHLSTGIDFIYIYDNDSTVPLKSVLSDVKNIEIIDAPGKHLQIAAYNDFINKFRNKIKWGAFIDADEFIISRCGNIQTNLADHERFGGLGLSWLFFGSNNLLENKTNSQIKAFTKRAHQDFNKHIKTIAQLKVATHCIDPHQFSYAPGYFCANELGHPCHGALANFTNIYIYINHYYTRSRSEYGQKLAKGRADGPFGRGEFEVYDRNEIEDLTAIDVMKKLKTKNL